MGHIFQAHSHDDTRFNAISEKESSLALAFFCTAILYSFLQALLNVAVVGSVTLRLHSIRRCHAKMAAQKWSKPLQIFYGAYGVSPLILLQRA